MTNPTSKQLSSTCTSEEAVEALDPYSESLAEFFQAAIDDDTVDVIIVLARRSLALFYLLVLTGRVHVGIRDLLGRIVSQRAAERDPSIISGKNCLILDDTAKTYETLKKYVPRIHSANPASMDLRVFLPAQPGSEVVELLSSAGVDLVRPEGGWASKSERTQFGIAASAAIMRTGTPFFVDFPVYQIRRVAVPAWLVQLRRIGWEIRTMPLGESASGLTVYVCAQMHQGEPTGVRVRIVDFGDGRRDATVVVKDPRPVIVDDSDMSPQQRESLYRNRMFAASVDQFHTLNEHLGLQLVELADPRVDTTMLHLHWPMPQWGDVTAKMNVSVDGLGVLLHQEVAEEGDLVIDPIDNRAVTRVQEILIGTPEGKPGCLKQQWDETQIGYSFDDVVAAAKDAASDLTRLDVQYAIDVLSDRSVLTPRVRDSGGAVDRTWTPGEEHERAPLEHANVHPTSIPLRSTFKKGLNTQQALDALQITGEELATEIHAGRIPTVVSASGNWFPAHLTHERWRNKDLLEEITMAMPSWQRRTKRSYQWLLTERVSLSGRSPLEAANDGAVAAVLDMARTELAY